MPKSVRFGNSERNSSLILQIEKYQKAKKHKHFIDALRELCDIALKFDEIKKK